MQFQMNTLNNPMFCNKSQNELRLNVGVQHFIFMSDCLAYILQICWAADFDFFCFFFIGPFFL